MCSWGPFGLGVAVEELRRYTRPARRRKYKLRIVLASRGGFLDDGAMSYPHPFTSEEFPAGFLESISAMSVDAEADVRRLMIGVRHRPGAWEHADGRGEALAEVLSLATGEPATMIRVRSFEAAEERCRAGLRGVAKVRQVLNRSR